MLFYWDNGNENGNYYNGLYRDYRVILGQEDGIYYIIMGYIFCKNLSRFAFRLLKGKVSGFASKRPDCLQAHCRGLRGLCKGRYPKPLQAENLCDPLEHSREQRAGLGLTMASSLLLMLPLEPAAAPVMSILFDVSRHRLQLQAALIP